MQVSLEKRPVTTYTPPRRPNGPWMPKDLSEDQQNSLSIRDQQAIGPGVARCGLLQGGILPIINLWALRQIENLGILFQIFLPRGTLNLYAN